MHLIGMVCISVHWSVFQKKVINDYQQEHKMIIAGRSDPALEPAPVGRIGVDQIHIYQFWRRSKPGKFTSQIAHFEKGPP